VEPFVYVVVSLGCLCLIAIVVILLLRRKSQIAAVPLTHAGAFALPIPPGPADKPVDVWIRYSVSFPYYKPFGLEVSQNFSLLVDLEIDGVRSAYAAGVRSQDGRADFEGLASYMTHWAPGGPDGRPSQYTATVLVKRLPTRPRVVQGAVYGERNTTLNHAEVSVRG
jgi:hypothetical protein